MRNNQWTKNPRTSLELILAKCEEDTETNCLVWTGYADPRYGRVMRNKQLKAVHREVYEEAIGPIPDGAVIHHLCRNTLCANVEHLICMTPADHATLHLADPDTKRNSNKTHCKRGHEFTPENTYVRPDGTGRHCKTCDWSRYVANRDRDRLTALAC